MKLPTTFTEKIQHVNALIESPKGSRHKFVYDPDLQLFRLKRTLPAGMIMPFDFGFVPGTLAEDGDPVDILVLMESPAFPGCVVETRVVGAIEAETQTSGKSVRNDRIIGVAAESLLFENLTSLSELNNNLLDEIIAFFKNAHQHDQKVFKPLGTCGPENALELIKKNLAP